MTKIISKIILAVCLFCLIQGLGSNIIILFTTHLPISLSATNTLALTLITTGLLSCLVLVALKMIRPTEAFATKGLQWKSSAIAFTAAVSGIFALDLLGEQADLPDIMKNQLLDMAHSGWGMLALGLVGPVVEELYFREGIQGFMHRNGVPTWAAIIIASLCFGIIHFNPAQIPFACGIGLILGMIYYKTGNVILTSFIHIFNNSIAILEMRILDEEVHTFNYQQALGGALPTALITTGSAAICLWLLHKYWKLA